jgi:valyl-tRNA synthetase
MSKSRGNVVDPLEWIDEYGADAVRLSLAQGANPGADQAINEEWVKGARNFCTKLWNVTRFALLNGATVDGPLPAADRVGATDAWILSRLQQVHIEVDALYERYEFAKVSDLLYHFAWDEVCDWYVELSKPSLNGPAAADARRVLGEVLDVVLKLLHPLIPFVTEALWTQLTGGESIVIAPWPTPDPDRIDRAAENASVVVQAAIRGIRQLRSDNDIKPSQRVPAKVSGLDTDQEGLVRAVARLDPASADFAGTAQVTTLGGALVELDLTAGIDVVATRTRLERERQAAEKERAQNAGKLANAAFTDKAPEPVIAKVRDRLAVAEAELVRVEAALRALGDG